MPKFTFGRIAMFAVPLLLCTAFSTLAKDATFTGEIMDSQCAKTSRLHPMMNKAGNAVTAKQCTLKCVKELGSVYVLYDPETKMVYQLDDQARFDPFAGEKVSVSGNLDESTQTIHVKDVKSAN